MNGQDIWRTPPECTTDYPGLEVQDDRVSGSINIGQTRLPLWAIIADVFDSGWEDAAREYDIPGDFTERDFIVFLYSLLEQRGEFARLICILADLERPVGDGPDEDDSWWLQDPVKRSRATNQLKRCLNAINEDPDQAALRKDCCLDWPKPCGYHEGYLDGHEAATTPTTKDHDLQ